MSKAAAQSDITEEQVLAFLKRHPDFLKKNLAVMNDLSPPERDLGNGIIDFQHYKKPAAGQQGAEKQI
jgi:uncharacterized protein YigA (DUF484 family)